MIDTNKTMGGKRDEKEGIFCSVVAVPYAEPRPGAGWHGGGGGYVDAVGSDPESEHDKTGQLRLGRGDRPVQQGHGQSVPAQRAEPSDALPDGEQWLLRRADDHGRL